MKRLLIIGGSDAGISAALRARELRPDVDVRVVVADRYPNYSICGIPYYLSGEVESADNLAHRNAADIESAGIQLLLDHTAEQVDAGKQSVIVSDTAANDTPVRQADHRHRCGFRMSQYPGPGSAGRLYAALDG